MTTSTDEFEHEHDSEGHGPFEHVSDRIDQVTASGLDQRHDALESSRQTKLRSVEIETQAAILWNLVEQGTINLDITSEGEGRE